MQVKWDHLSGHNPIGLDRCPYKRRSGNRGTEREDCVKTEYSHLLARNNGLRPNQPCCPLVSEWYLLEPKENKPPCLPPPLQSTVLFCGRPGKLEQKASLGVGHLTQVLTPVRAGTMGTCQRTAFPVKKRAGVLSSWSKLRKVKREYSRIQLNVFPNCPDFAKGMVCRGPLCPFCEEPQKKFHLGPVIKRNCASLGTLGMSTVELLWSLPSIVFSHVPTSGTF